MKQLQNSVAVNPVMSHTLKRCKHDLSYSRIRGSIPEEPANVRI